MKITFGNIKYSIFVDDNIDMDDDMINELLKLENARECNGGVFGNYVVFECDKIEDLHLQMHRDKCALIRVIEGSTK